MAETDVKRLVEEFTTQQDLYEGLCKTIADLLRPILDHAQIVVHSIDPRAKAPHSLEKKLQQPGKIYDVLSDITDLSGVRVISYFHDDVDRIAELVRNEFTLDLPNCVDKRADLDTDRFGYLSLHYVVELSPSRAALTEYKRFAGLKTEIQIRSLLQHVWAEIEHDLGYKSTVSVPAQLRRRFARLAGLMEMADAEFVGIRDALKTYEKDVPQRIKLEPENVHLDKASLMALISESTIVREVDEEIASHFKAKLDPPVDGFVEIIVGLVAATGLETIKDLESSLQENAHATARFAGKWLTASEGAPLLKGISIGYLAFLLVGRSGNPEAVKALGDALAVGPEGGDNFAKRLTSTATEVDQLLRST